MRKALRARFSDFDFCRPPTNGIFFRPLKRLPIERMKWRREVSFSVVIGGAMADVTDDIFDFFISTVVVTAMIVAAFVVCEITVVFGQAFISTTVVDRSSIFFLSLISSTFDLGEFIELTITVTGRSAGRSVTLTVVLNLLHVSDGVIPVGDIAA